MKASIPHRSHSPRRSDSQNGHALQYLSEEERAHAQTPYSETGVDRSATQRFIESIKPLAESTRGPGLRSSLGGFGGIFDLKAALPFLKDPLLVSSTDGIGTKAYLAKNPKDFQGLGIDLVAMCVNDILTHGATPLFFLDYLGIETLEEQKIQMLMRGIALGCREAGCALIGGETAQMPGLYTPGRYDLAGFVVGAVERQNLLPKTTCKPNDVLLGLQSSGLHANGFSLVRRIVESSSLSWDDPAPFAPQYSLREVCLKPSRIYKESVLSLLRVSQGIKAIAHITGGGLIENIPRVLPPTLVPHINPLKTMPPLFHWLADEGNLSIESMMTTFNCGIGLVFVVDPEAASSLKTHALGLGETLIELGDLKACF